MSAHLTRTTVAGAFGVLLAAAGPALATPAAINDLGDTLSTHAGAAPRANDLEVVINRWLDGTTRIVRKDGGKTQNASGLQFVSLKVAASGKAPAFRCKTVSGIRAWSDARARLLRQGYRRLHVIRFMPRQMRPMADLKGYAQCTGGWYVLTASKGKLRYRLALNARTLKVGARVRIGVERRRQVVRRRARPAARKAASSAQAPVYRSAARSVYRQASRPVFHRARRLGLGHRRSHR